MGTVSRKCSQYGGKIADELALLQVIDALQAFSARVCLAEDVQVLF